jgi:radical SAM superfamily enzyme YgiQ (UPF0313 family)
MRVLLIIPPMTQLNTPYPSTAYLTGFLRSRGVDAAQADLALALVLRLFCREGFAAIAALAEALPKRRRTPAVRGFLAELPRYLETIDPVIRFLQGRDPSLGYRIGTRGYLPEGPRFQVLAQYQALADESGDPLSWAFGTLGLHDRARHLATLYLDDLADVVREAADPRFEFVRYGERLAESQPTFDPLAQALDAAPTLVDRTLDALAEEAYARHRPDLVGISAPFPGNVYGAFRIAQAIRKVAPGGRFVLGGGYVNTELRSLADPRVFDTFDYVTLDDGERPMLCLLEHLEGRRGSAGLCRTFVRHEGEVVLLSDPTAEDVPFAEIGTPTWDGLPIDQYLLVLEMLNPMHRLWSDTRWNKLTVAHGCYWKKCSFCDVSLDYISRYEVPAAEKLADRIDAIVAETGQTGFHFVDEAAPPAGLKALAEVLIARGTTITWWGNIRFEKAFTPKLARLLARSGCVAVSGGLEVASDRLLARMNKGVSVAQVARVTHALAEAGILVHAYLMYGFPTQTRQDTVDALEYVRQLFAARCVRSAFWHRFAATAHSPVGRDPEAYGIRLVPMPEVTFARNDLPFEDPTGCDHDVLGVGLDKALYNFMHGNGLDEDVRAWFDVRVPRPTVPEDFVTRALA